MSTFYIYYPPINASHTNSDSILTRHLTSKVVFQMVFVDLYGATCTCVIHPRDLGPQMPFLIMFSSPIMLIAHTFLPSVKLMDVPV